MLDIFSYTLGKKAGGGSGGGSGITPVGTKEITENGIHDVTEYAEVDVNVDTLTEFLRVRNGEYLFHSYAGDNVPEFDASVLTNMHGMFNGCSKLTTIPLLDTSNVINMGSMFNYCTQLTTIPLLDTSNATNFNMMFSYCSKLTTIPLLNTSNVTNMSYMFQQCKALLTIPEIDTSSVTNMNGTFYTCSALTSIPQMDTSKVTNTSGMFHTCKALTSIPPMDIRNVTNTGNMFTNCTNLTNINLKNIKIALTIGSGTTWGYLLTVDSLVGTIYELRDTGSSKTLSMGTTNLAKLASVYVKTIDITDEMRAEDDLVGEKLPFVVCESTDEGAMLITDYVLLKNWKLA